MDCLRKLIEERKKQPPEVFYKKGFLKHFASFKGKTPVSDSLYNKFADLKSCNFTLKRDSNTRFFL